MILFKIPEQNRQSFIRVSCTKYVYSPKVSYNEFLIDNNLCNLKNDDIDRLNQSINQ